MDDLPDLIDDPIDIMIPEEDSFHPWQSPEDPIDSLYDEHAPIRIGIPPTLPKIRYNDNIVLSFEYNSASGVLESNLRTQDLLTLQESRVADVIESVPHILRKQNEIFLFRTPANAVNEITQRTASHIVQITLESLYLQQEPNKFTEYFLKTINHPIAELREAELEISTGHFLPRDKIVSYFCWVNTIFSNNRLEHLQFVVRY